LGQTSKRFYELSKKDYVWKEKAKALWSKDEIKKVNKGLSIYPQIVKGKTLWDKFEKITDSTTVTNQKKLNLLTAAADNENEDAIEHLLDAYRKGWYGDLHQMIQQG
jgi:F0F1-type ATP synthase delta subunit